jgi:hypothetical protein
VSSAYQVSPRLLSTKTVKQIRPHVNQIRPQGNFLVADSSVVRNILQPEGAFSSRNLSSVKDANPYFIEDDGFQPRTT